MPGMQHDNNNIDGYRDQESKNEEETCGRGFRRGQETRAERATELLIQPILKSRLSVGPVDGSPDPSTTWEVSSGAIVTTMDKDV